jgi:hypothetical protein
MDDDMAAVLNDVPIGVLAVGRVSISVSPVALVYSIIMRSRRGQKRAKTSPPVGVESVADVDAERMN